MINKFFLLLIPLLFLSSCSLDEDTYVTDNTAGNTFLSYNLNTIRYDDLRFPVSSVRVQGTTNVPDYEIFVGGVLGLAFSPTTMEQAFLTMQFPHSRISNSTIYPHFHWSYKTAGAGNVVWCMEYSCANKETTFPSTTSKCITDTANGILKHHMTSMIKINNTLTESSMCSMRIFRNATNTNDTFNQDALLLEYDIHYLTTQYGQIDGHFE